MSGEHRDLGGDLRGAIPQELSEFFSIGGRSLLIRGGAGTGKTTLAITLLMVLGATKNFLYLSTRESPKLLRRDHPWLGEAMGGGKKPTGGKREDSSPPSSFIDARLDEPTQLFEKITSQLMDANSPLILIDTLDALEDFIDPKAMKTNVRVLQTWCERAGARLVVTMEDPESTSLDSLMDGVVSLKQKVVDERRLRQMDLLKLYGVKISRPSHLFTLNNGWFRSFSEPRQEDLVITPGAALGAPIKRASAHPTHFSTGFREVDSVLGGGIPAGSVVSLSLDRQSGMKVAFLLVGRIIANFPGEGSILLGPLEGLEPEFELAYLEALPRAVQSRIATIHGDGPVPGKEIQQGPALIITGNATTTASGQLRPYVDLARATGGVLVSVERDPKRRQGGLVPDASISISSVGGAYLVATEAPFSQYMGVNVASSGGLPRLDLEPVV